MDRGVPLRRRFLIPSLRDLSLPDAYSYSSPAPFFLLLQVAGERPRAPSSPGEICRMRAPAEQTLARATEQR